jgi:type II secretory pathway component GspD/PulD (secretin)
MHTIERVLIACAVAGAVAAPPRIALAQRGGVGGQKPPTRQPAKPDTSKKAPPSVSLDYQDQDLKVVLDALAAAGEINVSLTNIPAQKTTVHMGRPVTREGMIELIKTVAESNGLKVTESASLIQISGPAPEPVRQQPTPEQRLAQQLAQQNQAQQMHVFTYRLRHASAVQLAPVLSNLFTGYNATFGGRGNTVTIPNANGGFTTFSTPPNNIATPITVGGGGGRAGRGGNVGAAGGGVGGNNPGNAGIVNNAVANALANALQGASGALSSQAGDIRIIAEESSNSLLIRATDSDWALVQQIIGGVDLRPLQVLIEVTIAEVQRTRSIDFGVSGVVKNKDGHGNIVSGTAPSQSSALDLIAELTGGHGSTTYDLAIAALEQRGDVRVLSLPVIIAQNNRQAVLNVGSSRPFVQISQTVPNDPSGRVQTVQYIDVGTTLTITPTINPDGYVNLQVTQTDNSATNQIQFDAPVIDKREATTQIFIRDGQTTVIGGLADNTRTGNQGGIPLISRIPFIGPLLFGNYSKSDETNELFLFLTPHIISSDDDIDKLRDAVKDGSDLLKQVNVGPHIQPKTDTLNVQTKPIVPGAKPPDDSVKQQADSLTRLRRRPPAPPDSTPTPPPPVDTLTAPKPPGASRWR